MINLKGTKIVEIPYFLNQIDDININTPESYKQYCNPYTPNMIWGLTLKIK